MSTLSQNLKTARKLNSYTQTEVSQLLKDKYGLSIDRVMISKWETGFQAPSVHNLKCIAEIYNTTMDALNSDNLSAKQALPHSTQTDVDGFNEPKSGHSLMYHLDGIQKEYNLSPEAISFIKNFLKLGNKAQETLLTTLNSLVKKDD